MVRSGVMNIRILQLIGATTLIAVTFNLPAGAAGSSPSVPELKPRFNSTYSRKPQTLSPADVRIYSQAFDAADRRNWPAVANFAGQTTDKVLLPVLDWLRILRKGPATPDEISLFAARYGTWPRLSALKRRQEALIADEADDSTALAHFTRVAPATLDGKLRYATLLAQSNQAGAARKIARTLWHSNVMTLQQETRLRTKAGFRPSDTDLTKRLDTLIWAGSRSAAARALSATRGADRRLGDARFRLRFSRAGVDQALARLTPAQAQDSALVYERVRWRRKRGRGDGAVELLLNAPETGARASQWWTEKRIHIRRLIIENRAQDAYQLTVNHGLTSGARFAEAQFLAGWIALRFINRPDLAEQHFRKLAAGVRYPVSVARAAYWLGRTLTVLNRKTEAREWFARAAGHRTTFYGQLAASEIGFLPGTQRLRNTMTSDALTAYQNRPLARIVARLADVDQHGLARLFLTHLVRSAKTDQERRLSAEFARGLNDTYLLLLTGKLLALQGMQLPFAAYPDYAPLTVQKQVATPLAHAIARQESVFNPQAISHVGARGLMQLMPATARLTAPQAHLAYTPRRLLTDPVYNSKIGSTYLAGLIEEFDGYLPFAIAGYNAGPHRVRQWLKKHGDPRNQYQGIDPIDWIELIPFSETRNYVQRVIESLHVYREKNPNFASDPFRTSGILFTRKLRQ